MLAARRIHAVGRGLALRRQNVVDRLMRAGCCREVVVEYYSKPDKQFEKYNPAATSTRFDFVKETYNNAKTAEDTDLLTVAYYKSDWVSYTYEEALQEDLVNCANGLFNKYNPWVTGTWRNY